MMKTTIQSSEAKARFSELLERVRQGEEFTITHYEQPVARLLPLQLRPGRSELEALFTRIDAVRKGAVLNPAGQKSMTIKDAIAEGRR